MSRRRRAGGAVLAALGALGVSASAYLHWFDGRTAQDIPIDRLFDTDVSGTASSYWTSVAVALAVVALLGVVGALLGSRLLLTVGWLVGVATLALWVVMQALDSDSDGEAFTANDVQAGAWVCTIALLLMLVGIASMGRRQREPKITEDEPAPDAVDPVTDSTTHTRTDNPL